MRLDSTVNPTSLIIHTGADLKVTFSRYSLEDAVDLDILCSPCEGYCCIRNA